MFVCYSVAFGQLCFYNKDWIGLDWNNSKIVELTREIERLALEMSE